MCQPGEHREWHIKSSMALKHKTQQFSVNLVTIFRPSVSNYHIQNSTFTFKKKRSTPLQGGKSNGSSLNPPNP